MENSREGSQIITEPNVSDVSTIDPELQIFDLYTVSPEQPIQPFIHQLSIKAKGGEIVRVKANFDDGALANAMSTTKFNAIKHRLGHYGPSSRRLWRADSSIISPTAVWHGKMEIKGVQVQGSFEVFESGGNWEFLLGKPLLAAFHAVYDTITIGNEELTATLKNQAITAGTQGNPNQMGTTKGEQGDLKGSGNVLPSREVLTESHNENEHTVDIHLTGNSHTKETWPQQEEPQCTPAEVR
jgi:hypothetical protein